MDTELEARVLFYIRGSCLGNVVFGVVKRREEFEQDPQKGKRKGG